VTDHQRLRVLDLTDDLALGAGRLLVGMGADVIRIAPAGREGAGTPADLHWHLGKRVMAPSPETVTAVIARLLPGADVVIESGPVRSLRTLAMRSADPDAWNHVAHVVVTPFGLTGPRAEWLADDTVASAAGGMAWLGGFPGEEPRPAPREQALQLSGTHAVLAAQLALLVRERTGRGQLAEVSAQEAVAATLETGAIAWIHAGTIPARSGGVYGHVAHRVFGTSDGYVAGGWSGPDRMWTDLLAWLVEEDAAADLVDPAWKDATYRWQRRDHVDKVVASFVRTRSTAEIAEEGRRRALPWAAVARPDELLDNPQLLDRDYFVQLDLADTSVRDVGFPYRSPGRPETLAPPLAVDADAEWLDTASTAPARTNPPRQPWTHRPDAGPRALDGLRVLDLTWVLAGPYMTKILAEHGADVLKVESRHRQDPTRFSPSMRLRPDAGPDDSGYFLNFNRAKRSIALNLRTKAGVSLLRDLAARADVIVENFAPGVLARWGLDLPDLRELNPDVLLVSMAGVGATGPWRQAVTFADTLSAMSGLTFETGEDTRAPYGLTFGLGDMVAANAAAVAALDHLLAGVGGHVDLSQLEAMTAHLGTVALDHQLPAEPHDVVGPFILPAPGEDRWLGVGATDGPRLAAALGIADRASVADINSALRDLASSGAADEVADRLQSAGIGAYPVRDGRDLVTCDEQLAARGFYLRQCHPVAGEIMIEGLVEHLTVTPGRVEHPAPLLGEHTEEILTTVLGLEPTGLDALRNEGVLE